MSIHYCFIARDSNMLVFELLINNNLGGRSFKKDVVSLLTDMDSVPAEERDEI